MLHGKLLWPQSSKWRSQTLQTNCVFLGPSNKARNRLVHVPCLWARVEPEVTVGSSVFQEDRFALSTRFHSSRVYRLLRRFRSRAASSAGEGCIEVGGPPRKMLPNSLSASINALRIGGRSNVKSANTVTSFKRISVGSMFPASMTFKPSNPAGARPPRIQPRTALRRLISPPPHEYMLAAPKLSATPASRFLRRRSTLTATELMS